MKRYRSHSENDLFQKENPCRDTILNNSISVQLFKAQKIVEKKASYLLLYKTLSLRAALNVSGILKL